MIPTYNCIGFLKEALESVLQQDLGADQMQIEVVDDCSTNGDVQALVNELGKGRVTFFSQQKNVGSLRNFETCINRATGRLVHLLHGDDRVKNGFYARMTAVFERFPEAGAAFCGYEIIDKQGNYIGPELVLAEKDCILENFLHAIAVKQRLQYVSTAVKREVYEDVGGFFGVTYGEDWEMWVRIARKYPVAYAPVFLAQYRMHFDSISFVSYSNGKNLRDIVTVIKTFNKYLPEPDRKRLYKLALKNYTYWACDFMGFVWYQTKRPSLIYRQVFEILRVYRDAHLIIKSGQLLLSVGRWQLKNLK